MPALRLSYSDMAGPIQVWIEVIEVIFSFCRNRGLVTSDSATVDQTDIRGLVTA
jgi:hypothetical protein